ncbi:hypothetical protein FLJU110815_11260 [Flavobacterium jumunjinense]
MFGRNGLGLCSQNILTQKNKMKKIFLYSFLAISVLSCKKEKTTVNSQILLETKKDTLKETEITIAKVSEDLKNNHFSKELSNYTDEVINKIAENMIFKADLFDEGEKNHLKEITSFENNIISFYWETCGTGGCVHYQKMQIKNNNIIDLGNGFDKLTESETLRLENIIKLKNKNFSHISGRSETDIKLKENGNYLMIFSGLEEAEGEATGGSLEITYETNDLKTFITNSVKVLKRV